MAYYKDFIKTDKNPTGVFENDGRGRLFAHRLTQITNIYNARIRNAPGERDKYCFEYDLKGWQKFIINAYHHKI